MATGYKVYCPSTSFNTYSGKWGGSITTWAWEFETYVKVRVKFYTTQHYLNNKVQGTDYFYGTVVINGTPYDFKIAYLGYSGANSSDTFEEEIEIPFNSSGKAELSIAVSVQGAPGTYLQGYSLGGSLSHTFSNEAKAGTLELSPSAKQMGDTATLAVKDGEGTVRYKISYAFGSITGLVTEQQMIAENASLLEHQWVIPDLLEGCPNAAGGLLTLTCETYRFSTLIGTSQVQREISAFPAVTPEVQSTVRIGYGCTISVPRPTERYSTTLRCRLLGQEHVIAEGILADAYDWEIPLSVGKLMPASASETLYLYCDSYHGTALVGTGSCSCKITANITNDLYRPVIDAVRIRRYVPDAPEAFQGILLQNVSLADFYVDAHSDSSELESYTFRGFGREITISAGDFVNFPAIPANANSGSHTISIGIRDRRGMTETNYYTLSILPYNKPKVIPYAAEDVRYSAPVCFRADREGMAAGAGTWLRILAGKQYTRILSGETSVNACQLTVRVRKTGEDWPETETVLLPFESETDFVSRNLEDIFPDPDASYQVELKATDLLGFSHCYLAKVSSQKVNFSLLCAADGAAFGKTAEHPGVVEIAQDMTLWVRGRLKVDGESWQELDTVDSGEIWESGYVHGQKGVSGCFYRREQGGRICAVFNRAIRWGGSPITVNADPIPGEDCPDTPVSALCPAENGFVLATVGTDGYITVDLAWSAGSTAQHNWIDGSIQYWKEES